MNSFKDFRRVFQEFVVEMRRNNDRLKAVEDEKDGDIQICKHNSDVHARLVEIGVNRAIGNFLVDATLLVETGYRWCSEPDAELDGLVAGSLNGAAVLVFVESKTSIPSMNAYRKARKQLERAVSIWKSLADSGEDRSEQETQDMMNLNVAAHTHRSIIFAFGAHYFPILESLGRKLKEDKEKYPISLDVLLVAFDPQHQYKVMSLL